MRNIKNNTLDTHTTSQQNIEAELIRLLYSQGHTALIGVIATATVIAIIYFNNVPNLVVGSWLLSIYGLSFVRYLSIKKFHHLDEQTTDINRWGLIFTLFAFLSGLTWGAASIIFFTPDNVQLFNVLTLIIIAMSVGSLAALSAYPKAYYCFVIPAMLPMIWRYLSIDEQSYIFFGILLFVFIFALFSIVKVNRRILHDSTALRFKNIDLINQLTEQKEKAEQANISKTKFLAAASHDLRQPLHAIGLFLGALSERVEKEDQKNIVKKIEQSSNALNSLLDSLLDISKLDAGIIKVESEPFCLNSFFDLLQNEFKPAANEKGLTIKFVRTTLWVDSDYQILERITRNLISNAIKYTNTGGVVVGCRRYQGKILLAIYDTGIGIPEDKIDDVFSEFYQLHNPERDRSKGLGLGLSIVQRMAKLLDAPLVMKSTLKKGSMFGVILSHSPQSKLNFTATARKADTTFFDNKRVLVIDDEEENRNGLFELLHSWHCDIITAASEKEAVHLLKKCDFKPDIILADYRLRENKTGIEAIDKINSLYEEPAIPAIIITGDTAPERIKEAEMSRHTILHKPVKPEELRLLLAEFLT